MNRKRILPMLAVLMPVLAGCGAVGEKSSSLVLLYAATAVLAALMLLGYFLLEKKRQLWFTVLFVSVTVVNTGYFLLSVSPTLTMALWANRLSYLGSVFLPLSMLMIVLDVAAIRRPKHLSLILVSTATLVFLLAASYPVLNWYYEDVTLHIVAGASHINKEYGSLHIVYLFYLLAHFASMITVSVYAAVKKRLETPIRTATLCAAVFINIGVWLVEQFVNVEFEILAISYIITELFLLGLHMVAKENDQLKKIVAAQTVEKPVVPEAYTQGLRELTHTERMVYNLYIEGKSSKEVMEQLNITENTLKYHNKNIYSKLGVSSRKEMLQYGTIK